MATEAELRQYLSQIAGFRLSMRPKGWTYSGAEDYTLDRGRLFDSRSPLTDEEATIVDEAAAWHGEYRTKECFVNAQRLVLNDDSGLLRYCEGFACGGAAIAVHHAWAAINGKVVDLTWRKRLVLEHGVKHGNLIGVVVDEDNGTWENRVLGVAPDEWIYFGCDDFIEDSTALRTRLLKEGHWLAFLASDWPVDDIAERMRLPRLGEAPVDLYTALSGCHGLTQTED